MKYVLAGVLLFGSWVLAQSVPRAFTLGSQKVNVVDISGIPYLRSSLLEPYFTSASNRNTIKLLYQKQTLTLPIDSDLLSASTKDYFIQINNVTEKGVAAVRYKDAVFVPLTMLSRAFGLTLNPSSLKVPVAQIDAVDIRSDEGYDRVVIKLSQNIQIANYSTANTVKLVLKNTTAQQNTSYQSQGVFVATVEVIPKNTTTTLSIPIPENSGYRYFFSPGTLSQQAQLLIDIGDTIPRAESAADMRKKKPVIVLDAGHGGTDYGINRGIREKDVTLEVARRVGEKLSLAGYTVVYTRTADTNPPLRERAALSRGSDVTLSFHVGLYPEPVTNSPNVSAVQLIRSTDQSSDVYISKNRSLKDGSVLDSNGLKAFSGLMAAELQAAGIGYQEKTMPKNYLLSDTPRAALMIELSSPQIPEELSKLRDTAYLSTLATAISNGVAAYLKGKP